MGSEGAGRPGVRKSQANPNLAEAWARLIRERPDASYVMAPFAHAAPDRTGRSPDGTLGDLLRR